MIPQKLFPLVLGLFLFLFGCSGTTNSPPAPATDQVSPQMETGNQVLMSGRMNLDEGTVELDMRNVNSYLHVTTLVGSNFSYSIDDTIPPDILDITLSVTNAYDLTAYDCCIVFENLYGKSVENADCYMDIYHEMDRNPIIAFRKEDPYRAFPMGDDTEQLLLRYPSGANTYVRFFLIAHLGGNTGGVYEIRDWNVDGSLTQEGGNATISVKILDYQDDVTSVTADTTALTGSITTLTQTVDPTIWDADITNSQHAPGGTYTIEVMSTSPSSPQYNTYNYFKIDVTGDIPILSIGEVPIPAGDTWYDVSCQAGGPIFVVTDHVSTGHAGGTCTGNRTLLRYDNDLTNETVITRVDGTGLGKNPYCPSSSYNPYYEWVNCDFSSTGNLITDLSGRFKTFSIVGDQVYPQSMYWGYYNWFEPYDVTTGISGSFGETLMGFSYEPAYEYDWGMGFNNASPISYNSVGTMDSIYWQPVSLHIDMAQTGNDFNQVILFEGEISARLAKVGEYTGTSSSLKEGATAGSYGSGDGQFQGTLDITVDSNNNIMTLEDNFGTHRFQKWSWDFTWQYSHTWDETGFPLRIDYDVSNDNMFLLCDDRIHKLSVY